MRSDVPHVEKERIVFRSRVLEELDRVIVERVRHEEAGLGKRPRLVIEIKVIVNNRMPVADLALAHGAEEAVKAF